MKAMARCKCKCLSGQLPILRPRSVTLRRILVIVAGYLHLASAYAALCTVESKRDRDFCPSNRSAKRKLTNMRTCFECVSIGKLEHVSSHEECAGDGLSYGRCCKVAGLRRIARFVREDCRDISRLVNTPLRLIAAAVIIGR